MLKKGREKREEREERERKIRQRKSGLEILISGCMISPPFVPLFFLPVMVVGFSGATYELTVFGREGFNKCSLLSPQICAVLAAVSEVQ